MNIQKSPTFDELITITDEDLTYNYSRAEKNSGLKFSIASLFFPLIPFLNVVGLMLAYHGYNKSTDDGYRGITGLIGMLLNSFTVILLIGFPFVMIYIYNTLPYDVCANMGAGNWIYEGEKYKCE